MISPARWELERKYSFHGARDSDHERSAKKGFARVGVSSSIEEKNNTRIFVFELVLWGLEHNGTLHKQIPTLYITLRMRQ